MPTIYKNNAKTCFKSKLRARLHSGLTCGQSRSPARTVFIRDVVHKPKTRIELTNYMNLQFLKLLYHEDDSPIVKTGLCCGFEQEEWRHKQFSEFLFENHLLDFALRYSEYHELNYFFFLYHYVV